jgi:hypothetical protein
MPWLADRVPPPSRRRLRLRYHPRLCLWQQPLVSSLLIPDSLPVRAATMLHSLYAASTVQRLNPLKTLAVESVPFPRVLALDRIPVYAAVQSFAVLGFRLLV